MPADIQTDHYPTARHHATKYLLIQWHAGIPRLTSTHLLFLVTKSEQADTDGGLTTKYSRRTVNSDTMTGKN